MPAVYIETYKNGLLREKIKAAESILNACKLCPRECGVNRYSGETGLCRTGKQAWVSSFSPHYGEEAPLVGRNGSGTIFFTHCNLMCLFCQNYDISHEGRGEPVSDNDLAQMMLDLQSYGCHNINFVTPSHVVPQILSALEVAIPHGLKVPLIYNTSGYDKVETLKLLDSVIDIYMPDFKFWDSAPAKATCNAEDYPEITRKAIIEMHRQVGNLEIDPYGIAKRGLLVRHLVLPKRLAGTREIMRFIVNEISPDTYVNIMPQYRPCGRAEEVEGFNDYPSKTEFEEAMIAAKDEGIRRFDMPRRVFMIC